MNGPFLDRILSSYVVHNIQGTLYRMTFYFQNEDLPALLSNEFGKRLIEGQISVINVLISFFELKKYGHSTFFLVFQTRSFTKMTSFVHNNKSYRLKILTVLPKLRYNTIFKKKLY